MKPSKSIYLNYSSKQKNLEIFVMNIPWLQWDQDFFSDQLFCFHLEMLKNG